MRTEAKRRPARAAAAACLLLAAIIAAAGLALAAAPASAGTSGTVTESHPVTEGYDTAGHFRIDGTLAFCIDHSKSTPDPGWTYTVVDDDVSNDGLRKVCWYGWGGPGDLGYSRVATTLAASQANGIHAGNTGMRVYAEIASMPSPPDSFKVVRWSPDGTSFFQDLVTWEYEPSGWVELVKRSADAGLTDGNSCYSLEGAVYEIRDSNGDVVETLVTDAEGRAASGDLEPGSYTVVEVEASPGYGVDATPHGVTVESGETAVVEASEPPLNDPEGVMVKKIDAQTGADSPQGGTSLALAEYTYEYYQGYYKSAEDARNSGKAQRSWVLRTDNYGMTDLQWGDDAFEHDGLKIPYKVAGDEFYYVTVGSLTSITVPLGTLVITETKAPEGYLLDGVEGHVVRIVPDGGGGVKLEGDTQIVDGNFGDEATVSREQAIRGGVKVSKRDLESGLPTPLGSASIDGTRFDVKTLNDNPVVCDGVTYRKGDVITTLVIKGGEASTAADLLPYGTYSIQEVAAGDGYLLTDGTAHEFEIRRHGEIVDGPAGEVKNQVKRGDLEFVKAREDDMGRLAGVPFRITSRTTGESHVLVTDENGQAKTSAEWNKHTRKTNANDSVADERDYDSEAGIWFGLTREGTTVAPDDALGALVYDTYDIEELPVAANDGLQLVNLEGVVVKRDSVVVDLGTIDDRTETEAYIHTTAHDAADGDKLVAADDQAVVTDHVEFTGLDVKWNYVMTATLMDKETGEAIGEPVSKAFTPAGPSGSVEMAIPVDLLEYAGKNVVVFEELTRDGRVVCDHKDLDDTEQTLRVLEPSIGTTAKDGVDGDQQAVVDPEAVIVDTVSYKNLVPGREYVVKGKLMLKSTGKALEVDGKPVVSEATFTPEDAHGTVDVSFSFDGSSLAGESVVVFETLYRLDEEVASHADIDDAGQTVTFEKPEIGTKAADARDGDKMILASGTVEIVDSVEYSGLVAGREYALEGILMKNGGESGCEPVLDASGKPVEGYASFTPDSPNGVVEVRLEFDASGIEGDLVVFERLLRGEALIAEHADPADEGQTVTLLSPSISTEATDSVDGDHLVTASKAAVVVDEVAYEGLEPGRAYVLEGSLVDPKTGEALAGPEGSKAAATVEFTPDDPNGVVEVPLVADASALGGESAVAFERLYGTGDLDGELLAEHVDVADAGQTVRFEKPAPEGAFGKTGSGPSALMAFGIAAIGAGTAAAAFSLARRRAEGGTGA